MLTPASDFGVLLPKAVGETADKGRKNIRFLDVRPLRVYDRRS